MNIFKKESKLFSPDHLYLNFILKGSTFFPLVLSALLEQDIKSTACSQLVFQLVILPVQKAERLPFSYKSIPVLKSDVNLSTENVYTALAA